VLTDEDKNHLQRVFGQTIHQVYQCTEGFLAATCSEGTLHFNEDFIMVEKRFINEAKTKFHPVITDLFRTTQPIVRYELNDIITAKEGCRCGSTMMAIESIEGRSDDMLIFENNRGECIRLFPDIFRRVIVLCDSQINDFCVTQTGLFTLQLYIQSGITDSYNNAEKCLLKLLNEYHINNVQIEKQEKDPHVTGTKKRRIKNATGKTH
jgi:putative adenylate-forming enzyme